MQKKAPARSQKPAKTPRSNSPAVSSPLNPEIFARWNGALDSYLATPQLEAAVCALSDRFFALHPERSRTPQAEAFIKALALDRITQTAVNESQAEAFNQGWVPDSFKKVAGI